MKLSILAIKNHPDICGVVEYLENLDLVPAQYGDLAFAMPSAEYADSFDAPIEWYKYKRSNCVIVNPDTGMCAYVAYSKSADTIVALANVLAGTAEMPSQDEQAISLHIINLLEKNGYGRKDIDVEYTNDPPETNADDPVKELFDSLTPVAYREQLAIATFNRCIPDAKFDPLSVLSFNDGGQAINMDIPFVLGGAKFVCRFKTMWRCTDKEWEHIMFIWPKEDESDELAIKDPYNARQELVNFYFTFPYFVERKFKNRLPEFTEKSVNLTADGTLEWKGTYRGKPASIQCKENKFSFSAPGVTGDDFTYEELAKNLENGFIPPETPGTTPIKGKEYYRDLFEKAYQECRQKDIEDGGNGGGWVNYFSSPNYGPNANKFSQKEADEIVGYYMAYHPADVEEPARPYKDWMENIDNKPETPMDKEITRILKALFEPECPFCAGKEVTFGSSQLTVKKEDDLAVVYDGEGVAGNFHWKFCPECGKKI